TSLTSSLDPRTTTAALLPLVATQPGVVLGPEETVAGAVVDPKHILFRTADHSQLWLILDVPMEDARLLKLGQTVLFRPDGSRADIASTISWINPEVNHKTRTVKIRAVIPNPKGELRVNTFGSGRVLLREEKQAIVVPNDAIHWEGDCHVVFVRDKDFLK